MGFFWMKPSSVSSENTRSTGCGLSSPWCRRSPDSSVVEDGFQVGGGDVAYNLLPDEREYLVLGGTFQAVRRVVRSTDGNLKTWSQWVRLFFMVFCDSSELRTSALN